MSSPVSCSSFNKSPNVCRLATAPERTRAGVSKIVAASAH